MKIVPAPAPEPLFEEVASWLKAIADPTRLRLLRALQGGERCVSDLLAELECSQANVSKHLATLRSSGIVECRREGVMIYYRIADPAVLGICSSVCDSLQRSLKARSAGLAQARPFLAAGGARP